MSNIKSFDEFSTNEKKGEKWIQDTKMRKGALHKQLGYDQDEKIPDGIIKKISKAKVGSEIKVKGEDKKVTTLLKKRANLAKTLKSLNEHQEHVNYMFFANLQNIRRMCDEILEMDSEAVDRVLTDGHNWALDHIATSKDDVEEVYGFLKTHDMGEEEHEEEYEEEEFEMPEYDEEEEENEEDEMSEFDETESEEEEDEESEEEMPTSNIKNFDDFQ